MKGTMEHVSGNASTGKSWMETMKHASSCNRIKIVVIINE